jgi:hypothetical protein
VMSAVVLCRVVEFVLVRHRPRPTIEIPLDRVRAWRVADNILSAARVRCCSLSMKQRTPRHSILSECVTPVSPRCWCSHKTPCSMQSKSRWLVSVGRANLHRAMAVGLQALVVVFFRCLQARTVTARAGPRASSRPESWMVLRGRCLARRVPPDSDRAFGQENDAVRPGRVSRRRHAQTGRRQVSGPGHPSRAAP